MKPYYEKEWVQALKVEKVAGDQLQLSFYVQPESMYYPSGVNYEVEGTTMRVTIDRCAIRQPCSPMVKVLGTPAANEDLTVRLPYHGETVVLVHADAQQQIYP